MAYSNRPWGSIARLPERYPYSSAYYHALFDGSLGYELAQGFARYPSLLGVTFTHDPFTRAGVQAPDRIPGVETGPLTFDLGYADENVVNYDRPLTLVWRNTGRLSVDELREIIVGDGEPVPAAMLSEEERARQTAGGTWTDVFEERGLNAWLPWLVWLAAVELVFLATLPLAVRLMRRLPDRGIVFARPLGLLLVAWIVWLGASAGLWTFSRASVAWAIVVVAAASLAALVGNGWMLGLARRRWRYLLSMEALFIAAYLAFVLVRAANPDLWHPWRGGEKPMDLAYLTAVVKSTTFPPYDPWFAGGYLNYYYFGFVIVGSLIRLTQIVPEVAYNLAVALLFALTLTGAYSAAYNLADALRQRGHARGAASRIAAGRRGAVFAGAAGALLVVVLANVDGAAQLLQGAQRMLEGEAFGAFDYWRSSRLMPGQISITEFPFWTFLFADLHAHLISLPFQALAVGLAANVVLGPRGGGSLRRLLPAVVALAFVVGSFAAVNTWDVPAYALLGAAAVVIAVLTRRLPGMRRDAPDVLSLVRSGALLLAAFAVALYAAWLPFHASYEAPFFGLRRSEWQTVLWHYAGIHALLAFIAASWLLVEAKRRLFTRGAPPAEPLNAAGGDAPRPARGRLRWAAALAAFALAAALVGAVAGVEALRPWTTFAVLGVALATVAALAVAWVVRRGERQAPVQLLLLGMLALAVGIGMGVDVVGARVDIDRMNTVFKFYLNAWMLYGIAGGVALWSLWAAGAARLWTRLGAVRAPWLVLLALLVLASAVFPVLGTRARIADRFDATLGSSLDGTAYMATAVYGDGGPTNSESDDAKYALAHDATAIDFLRANVEGSPVVLEGVVDHGYRWVPRTAKYAGLPVVVGWKWHQSQQRGDGGANPAAIDARLDAVAAMYRTTDGERFLELARKYDVAYVYVGPTERAYFPEAGLAKFEELASGADPPLERFYASEEVSVYRVVPAGDPAAGLNGSGGGDSLPPSPPGDDAPMDSNIQLIRDVLLSVYLVAGILLTLVLLVVVWLLFRAARKLLRSLTDTAEDVNRLTESVVDTVVKPLSEGVHMTTGAGNALGFLSGFLGGRRSRDKGKDSAHDKGNAAEKRRGLLGRLLR